jgi:hypothetical protein
VKAGEARGALRANAAVVAVASALEVSVGCLWSSWAHLALVPTAAVPSTRGVAVPAAPATAEAALAADAAAAAAAVDAEAALVAVASASACMSATVSLSSER